MFYVSKTQNTFAYRHERMTIMSFLELDNNKYAITFSDSIFIFSEKGEILDKKLFYTSDSVYSYYIHDFHKTSSGRIFSTGIYDEIKDKHLYLWAREYDEYLNTIKDVKYKINTEGREASLGKKSIINTNDEAVFAINLSNHLLDDTTYSFKFSLDDNYLIRDTINFTLFKFNGLIQMPNKDYYLSGVDRITGSNVYIKFDSTFHNSEMSFIDSLTNSSGTYHHGGSNTQIKEFSNNRFLIDLSRQIPENGPYAGVGVCKVDTNNNMLNEKFIGKTETHIYPVYGSGIDFIDTTNIFVVGKIYTGESFMLPHSITIAKLDENLNIKWQKFYEVQDGLLRWYPTSIHATKDGGLVLLTIFDAAKLGETSLIFKVDADGNGPFDLSNTNSIIKSHELIIYPNPGNENMQVRTAVQQLGGVFYIYDITGKLVLQQEVTSSITQINTSNLLSGTYIYKYINNNKLIESGKWVKE